MFYRFVRFLGVIICKILFFIKHTDRNRIPAEGGAVICANHRSMWDGIFIAVTSRRTLAFIAKQELFKNKLFGFVLKKLNCYPVRRDGSDLSVVKTAISLLKKGEVLVIFPEGERIRKGKKPVLKSGAFRLAMMAGVPIVPAGIRGNFRLFSPMHVHYGEMIDISPYKGQRFTEEEYSQHIGDIMKTVYQLAEGEKQHD